LLTVFLAVMLAGTAAQAQDDRPWLTPQFGGVALDAGLAEAIAASEKDDLLVWDQCMTVMGDPLPECLLLAIETGDDIEIIVLGSLACAGGDEACYGGYTRIADVTVGEDDRKSLEELLDVEGGLGGTPLGVAAGTECTATPELRVRVHGGIATSPMGVAGAPPGAEASLPELRVKVYGGIATSPLGVTTPDVDGCITVEAGLGSCPLGICANPTGCLIAEVLSMITAALE